MADELGVPLSYFFCEDDVSAELSIYIEKLSRENKMKLLHIIKGMGEG
jgi:hypothetical protein